ncbi:hypothetical protein [Kibdelosporangium aridum]|nr:hypothetical protein [Kibdelosporangium aridum]
MRDVSRRTGLIGFGICFLLVLAGFLINVAAGFRSTWSLIVGIFGLVAAASAVVIFLVVKPPKK